jgi:hypothetical protein
MQSAANSSPPEIPCNRDLYRDFRREYEAVYPDPGSFPSGMRLRWSRLSKNRRVNVSGNLEAGIRVLQASKLWRIKEPVLRLQDGKIKTGSASVR